jgi:hypothetical protein
VINWTLRLGLGMFKQVKPICESWIAIIDHSIDIGTKKALIVSRVKMDALSLLKPFIIRFANNAKVVSQMMKILKNKGLDQNSYQQCRQLLENLPNSKVKKRIRLWLQQHTFLTLCTIGSFA